MTIHYDAATQISICIDVLMALSFYLPMSTGSLFILPIGCMGTSAYVAGELAIHGHDAELAVLAGAGAGLVLAIVGGAIVVRMASWTGAIASLAMVEVLQTVFQNFQRIGGATGLLGVPVYTTADFTWILAGAAVAILLVVELSRLGDVFEAIRGNATAAECSAVRVIQVRMCAFAVSGILAGVAGALTAGYLGIVDPATYGLEQVNRDIIAVVIGGSTSALGSLLGGHVLNLVPQLLSSQANYTLLLLSLVVILVMLVRRDGLIARHALKRLLVLARRTTHLPARLLPSRPTPRFLAKRPAYTRLDVRGMAKAYSGLRVVDNVDVGVEAGQVVGIVGANGAGKTTLVDLITGVTRSDAGSVTVTGDGVTRRARRIRPTTAIRMGIARTFQNGALYPGLTARESVALVPGADADGLLERVGLTAPVDHAATSLSYGDQRLVAIARALATGPRFLLLDEPTAGMTNDEARWVGELIERLRGEGLGVLIIDHNVDFIARTCDRLVVMDFGKVLAHGTPEDVLRDDAVVAAYFGESDEQYLDRSRAATTTPAGVAVGKAPQPETHAGDVALMDEILRESDR